LEFCNPKQNTQLQPKFKSLKKLKIDTEENKAPQHKCTETDV